MQDIDKSECKTAYVYLKRPKEDVTLFKERLRYKYFIKIFMDCYVIWIFQGPWKLCF